MVRASIWIWGVSSTSCLVVGARFFRSSLRRRRLEVGRKEALLYRNYPGVIVTTTSRFREVNAHQQIRAEVLFAVYNR